MSIARAFAGALFACPLLLAAPAIAASHVGRLDQAEAHAEMLDRESGRVGGPQQFSSDWLDLVTSKNARVHQARLFTSPDRISDLIAPAVQRSGAALLAQQVGSNSSVPLPTGLSLFGAGLLTLGLVGHVMGLHRRLALETGCAVQIGSGPEKAQTAPSTIFRIEIRREGECQVRHAGSARGTIDLIADLLNEGWDIVCIRNRNGIPFDYEDILDAWHNERVEHPKRSLPLS